MKEHIGNIIATFIITLFCAVGVSFAFSGSPWLGFIIIVLTLGSVYIGRTEEEGEDE